MVMARPSPPVRTDARLPGPLAESAAFVLMQAGRLAMEWTAEALADVGLALSEFAVLALVQRFGGISQRAVGDRLGLSEPSVSRIAVMLERRHLVSRRQDLRSPRRRALYVTSTGVQLMANASRSVAAVDARFQHRIDNLSILALSELPPRSLTPVELAIRAAGWELGVPGARSPGGGRSG